jgi:hypothetical protein
MRPYDMRATAHVFAEHLHLDLCLLWHQGDVTVNG